MGITISAYHNNATWTASWWNPDTYHIQFKFTNDGENTAVLKNIQWAIVSGNSGGYKISPYGIFKGDSCTIAFYYDSEKVSSDVVIPKAPKCNLAHLLYSTAVLLNQSTDKDSCFFVPRYHTTYGNLEIANTPEQSQDTVEKVTRNIELLSGIEIETGKSITLTLKSSTNTTFSGILQVAPIDTITVNKGIIWVRENGEWVKKLYPHIFDSSTGEWSDLPVHKKTNSEWSDM